ncbi:hypothetical protein G6F24_016795 [Rhizopus arrhizus]|nr:hypothetical protein G6F24_016795 [Rhizopus arrhizus]
MACNAACSGDSLLASVLLSRWKNDCTWAGIGLLLSACRARGSATVPGSHRPVAAALQPAAGSARCIRRRFYAMPDKRQLAWRCGSWLRPTSAGRAAGWTGAPAWAHAGSAAPAASRRRPACGC